MSQIVDDHTDDDIRRCGGPIGSKRRQERRSRGLFYGFCPFSRREVAYLLPRFLNGVVRLLLPFFVIKLVARGCPGAELRPATSQTLKLLAGGQANHESFVAVRARKDNPIGRGPSIFPQYHTPGLYIRYTLWRIH